jgi:nicotinamide-nucleotide amidase
VSAPDPTDHQQLDRELAALAERAAGVLRARGETIGVAEGSCGGLVSAALLAVPGASAYYAGGAVIYTLAASKAFVAGAIPTPPGLRGATEGFARYLAESVRVRLETTWGIGEGGAAGPSGNPYGDPPGHAWVAVAGPAALGGTQTEVIATGSADREANMVVFATAALDLLHRQLVAPDQTPRTEP